MFSHYSDQMSQRSQVFMIALRRCSQNVFVFVFVIVFVFVLACVFFIVITGASVNSTYHRLSENIWVVRFKTS